MPNLIGKKHGPKALAAEIKGTKFERVNSSLHWLVLGFLYALFVQTLNICNKNFTCWGYGVEGDVVKGGGGYTMLL